jgi:hypothetical protein
LAGTINVGFEGGVETAAENDGMEWGRCRVSKNPWRNSNNDREQKWTQSDQQRSFLALLINA